MACFVPVLLIGVLFGLAMDQEVFLVSRMREHFHHQRDTRAAVEYGVERGGRVVTVAADNRNSLGPARRGPVTG
ncbi:MMPL family transporter [Streptomyces hokutonensis]|uniref:MMPL family transporter n=1 Tax=Streptomyces hokutonensis TaxID=1306990 RepID=A0ABW6M9J2_9ACTN